MKKIILTSILILTLLLSLQTQPVKAAAKKNAKGPAGVSVSYYVKRKRALVVYFKNLNLARSVSYVLSYTSNGVPKGAVGNLNIKKKYSLTRELTFGTASAGVFRYDTGIKNTVLEVTTVLKNGRSSTKRYKIKV